MNWESLTEAEDQPTTSRAPMNTPGERVVVITGADENYFGLLTSAIKSLESSRERFGFDLVILDFGLAEHQIIMLKRNYSVIVVKPEWVVNVPSRLQIPRNLAFGIRCALPKVVPGYDLYFWFDCDGWVQDERFLDAYLQIARRGALAIVREREPVYPFAWKLAKWNLGNQILAFGIFNGIRIYRSPFVNSGFFAMLGNHPAWTCWQRRFEEAVRRSGRIIMDQHSLRAAILLDKVPVEYLSGEYNWICGRAQPVFDREQGLFCVPYPPFRSIAIMHLAGESKKVEYDLECLRGGTVRKTLLFSPSLPD